VKLVTIQKVTVLIVQQIVKKNQLVIAQMVLMKMEIPGTGRVPVHRFYSNVTVDKSWSFSESMPYLRTLGALDESDPARPTVIIPNYLTGPNNCVAGSKFFDVCCIDECHGLVNHLEKHLAASEALPSDIASLVAHLPSDTVNAPRDLPDALLQRLEDIANHHKGRVPLHGRLFFAMDASCVSTGVFISIRLRRYTTNEDI